MEDEDGYMALQPQPRNETSRRCLQVQRTEGAPQCPQWHRIALGGCFVVILLLVGVVITQAIWVLQSKGTKCLPECEFRLQLKNFACSSSGSSTEGNIMKCKICPQDWKLHGESCYWFSKQSKTWAKSQEDCRAKNSTLVVIQNEEVKEFLKNITLSVWLGLTAEPSENGTWKWVDGLPLKKDLFVVEGPAEENSCIMKRENTFNSDDCDSTNHWICEKTAFEV